MNEQDKQRYKEALAEVRNQTIQECIDVVNSINIFFDSDKEELVTMAKVRAVDELQALIK